MFVYHNSNMAILVPHRCGHTNIHYYFGLEVYDYSRTFQEWIDHSRKIVVLRNPLERIVSTKSVPEDWKKWVEFTYHTKPFMDILLPYSFEIIPFRELNHYVPFYDKNWQSPVTQSVIDDLDAEKYYIDNQVYSLDDLKKECEIYQQLRTRPKISVKEWREITP